MGDDFARHKLVSFYNPSDGYKFVSIGWAGMTGVLSGMNEMGLTVTINAAKSTVPTSATMPISLLAREILQYASTIEEAYTIAAGRETFVAESLLIGSVKDNKAAIIEKSTDKIALYTSNTDRIICTNHYQSEIFLTDERNLKNIATSDSPYRYERLNELLDGQAPVNPEKTASVLRDRFGMGGKEIGLANEKAINQFIAHHSVIFQPGKQRMWASTSPWQSGKYVAYDLKAFFNENEIETIDSLIIAADTFIYSPLYTQLQDYRRYMKTVKESVRERRRFPDDLVIDSLLNTNPEMYYTWLLAGDYYNTFEGKEKAIPYWEKALTKEIPKWDEHTAISKRITKMK
jgi:hypothetical protein